MLKNTFHFHKLQNPVSSISDTEEEGLKHIKPEGLMTSPSAVPTDGLLHLRNVITFDYVVVVFVVDAV